MDQRFEVMLEPLRVFLAQIGDFLPRLALALIVLIAGWLIAKAVRFAIARGLRKVNFHVVTERAGIDGFLHDGGIRMDATRSEEHTSELQSRVDLVCRLLLEKKKKKKEKTNTE